MGIVGSPGGVEAAADTLEGAGRGFTDAADSIALHGRAVTADWTGSASDAASDAIAARATRTRVGVDVCAGVALVLRTFATELRAAQQAHDTASAAADAGVAAARAAHADQRTASAMVDTTAAQAQAKTRASVAAARAASDASDVVRAAHTAMADAVTRAERANQVAADAVDALTGELAAMDGAGSPSLACPATGPVTAPAPSTDTGGGDHGWAYNAFGGAGDAAWAAGPGLVGDVVGLVPTHATRGFWDWVQSGHDSLSDWYGADTDSTAYRGSDGVGQVATFFIPGEGWVKGGEAVTKADEALRLGDQLLAHGSGGARLSQEPLPASGAEWVNMSGALRDASRGKGTSVWGQPLMRRPSGLAVRGWGMELRWPVTVLLG